MLKDRINIIKGVMLLLLLGLAYSCSDNSSSTAPDPNPPEPPPSCEEDNSCVDDDSTDTGDEYNYQSDYAYNLNVIYFVPNNLQAKDNWHERLSQFLLFYQDYYKKWMQYWGYGETTFGLLKDMDKEMVKITYIEGDHPATYYPNTVEGARRIQKKVRSYFDANPQQKIAGKSWMVYIPRPVPHPPGGLPYFGLGQWAFIQDHDQQPINKQNVGGGDAHELGHALNLPHNANYKTRKNNIGTALMNNGNHVWNKGPGSSATSLTELDAAVLSVSQATSKEKGNFYGKTNVQFRDVKGHYANGDIVISGNFTTDVAVNGVFGVFDPKGRGEYDQFAIKSPVFKTAGTDSFHVSISINDIEKNINTPYTLSLWLVHENGTRSTTGLPPFSFSNGVPDIDFNLGAFPTLPKTGWVVSDFSDEAVATGKLAENIIDEDFGTWWHSDFGDNDLHPHTLTVDMSEKQTVKGFQFVQAPYSKWRSRIKRMELKVSDDGSSWTSLGKFDLANTKLPQNIKLRDKRDFRYFKIFTLESWESPDWKASSLAEVGVF